MAIITAAILFSPNGGANAAFTLRELQEIDNLIQSRDCAALWSHLQRNPALMQGDDPLAAELRNFSNGNNGGLVQCLSSQIRENTAAPVARAAY